MRERLRQVVQGKHLRKLTASAFVFLHNHLVFCLACVHEISGRLPDSVYEGTTMKKFLTTTALSLALALSAVVPAAMARPETRKEALKVCHDLYVQSIKTADDSYNAAVKDAKTKKGKERTDAMAAASKARQESKAQAKESEKTCIAKAPKK